MSVSTPMPRRAMVWLMICQILVVIPHLEHVPMWVLGVYLGAVLWRLQMYRQRADMPRRWIRMLLAIAAGIAIFASYRSLIGLEPMVALLLVATALKLVEAVHRRDGYTLAALGFFTCVTQFLFSQTLPVMLYSVLCTVLLVTAMITLNQRPGSRFTWQEPLLAVKMLALAVPMMVVLFVLFPRIGPLWSVPSKTGQGITGMSDFLRPGEVSRLSRSDELAFRAGFEGEIPPKSMLYWRGLVLSQFEEGTWRTLQWRDLPPGERLLDRPETDGPPLRYRVVMGATQQRWLYALPYAESSTAGVLEAWDYRLGVINPIEFQIGYDVESWPEAQLQPRLTDWRREAETAFPAALNPQTEQWVRDLRARLPDDQAFVQALLQFFREEPFYYTLQPPPIPGDDFVDRFIFGTRRGFCEHYAYAFVAMTRMAGLPSRIVAGYQGGEINELNNTVIVRQFDAHAWAEVWFPGEGWVRVDPTAAVSPARVELGLEAALSSEGTFLADAPLSIYRLRGVRLINWLRLNYDAVAFRWQSFIVGFDSERQLGLLRDWFGEIRVGWFVAVLLGSWALVLLPLMLWLHRASRQINVLPEEAAFLAVCAKLDQRGLGRVFGESPLQTLGRARRRLPPGDPLLTRLEDAIAGLYRGPSQGEAT